MYKITYNEELAHHGILGQKWGHRNGPPYPLDASAHSKAEKEAMGSSSKSGSSGSDSKSSKASSSDDISAGKKFVANQKKEGWNDLSYDEKFTVIELGVATTIVAASVASSKIHLAKEVKRLDKKLNDMYENRTIKTMKDIPKLAKPMTTEQNKDNVNPDFPDEGSVQNCMLCTTAMAMREKGYDVKARKIDEGLFEKNINKAFDGPNSDFKKLKAHSVDQIYDKLAKEGEGAYGNLTVQFYFGGGHSVFWKVENGKTHIYDGQSSEEYKLEDKGYTDSLLTYINPNFCQYARYDNAEPTDFVLGLVDEVKH